MRRAGEPSDESAGPAPARPVAWVLRRHAWLFGGSLLIMMAAPYLGSLPVRTIPAVVALASRPELAADQVPSAELTALLGGHANDLAWVLGLLVMAGLLSFLLALANTRVGARLSSVCARDLRAHVHEVLLARPPLYLGEANRGNHVRNALISQVRVVASFAANTAPASLGVLFAVIIWAQTLYSAVSGSTHDWAAAALVGGVVVFLIVVNLTAVWISGRKTQATQRQVMTEQSAFIGLVGESVENLEALQLDLAEPAQQERLNEVLQRMSDAEIRVATWSGLAGAASSGVVLLGIPLLVLAWQGLRLPGEQLAVMIPALLMLQRAIASIGSLWTNYKVAQPSVDLVTELLAPTPTLAGAVADGPLSPRGAAAAEPVSRAGDETPAAAGAHVQFRGVRWSARQPDDSSAREVLAGIDLEVQPGETVALVGAGGCGKSTMLRLLVRSVTPDAGSILLDGADIAGLDLRDVRARVAMLSQHPVFFARSVRDNLVLDGRLEARASAGMSPDQAMHEAAALTQFAEVLGRLPGGLDHQLPPGGGTLSGSEKRRLALTRVLLRAPRVILIDELEAGLPQAQAQDILAAVRRATRGMTCLMVTHRPDLLHADRVAFVHQGCIVDVGTHDELQARSEAYRSLLARRREPSNE